MGEGNCVFTDTLWKDVNLNVLNLITVCVREREEEEDDDDEESSRFYDSVCV